MGSRVYARVRACARTPRRLAVNGCLEVDSLEVQYGLRTGSSTAG